MGRQPGAPKTGGRKRGTPNKRSLDLVETLDRHNFNPIEKLFGIIPELSAKEQAHVLLGILPYLYPKRKSLDFTLQSEEPPTAETMSKEERQVKLRNLTKIAMSLCGAQKLLKPGVTIDQMVEAMYGEDKMALWRSSESDSEPMGQNN